MKPKFRKDETLSAMGYIKMHMHKCFLSRFGYILYKADMLHLAKYGRMITGEEYIAKEDGPYPRNLMELVCEAEFELPVYLQNLLSKSEIECLDAALKEYAELPADRLLARVCDSAWERAGGGIIKIEDMLVQAGEDEEYINFVKENLQF